MDHTKISYRIAVLPKTKNKTVTKNKNKTAIADLKINLSPRPHRRNCHDNSKVMQHSAC